MPKLISLSVAVGIIQANLSNCIYCKDIENRLPLIKCFLTSADRILPFKSLQKCFKLWPLFIWMQKKICQFIPPKILVVVDLILTSPINVSKTSFEKVSKKQILPIGLKSRWKNENLTFFAKTMKFKSWKKLWWW